MNGGSGGRPDRDGTDGSSFTGGWLRNVPNEVLEAAMPVLVEQYGYREGSAGAGRWRGGVGIHFRLRNLAPEALLTARGLERFTFRPWGLHGGAPAELGRVTLAPGTADERQLGKIDVLPVAAGEVVEFQTAGGGGFGDPFERGHERVAADVEAGLLDAEEAEREYGVVLAANRAVDVEATQERRRAARPQTRFAFGPERSAYELRRSEALADAVVEQVDPFPPSLRHLVRRRLDMRLDGLAAPSPHDVPALLEDIQRELGIGRRAAVAVAVAGAR